MFNRHCNAASHKAENHLNRCNDTDFSTTQHRSNISDKSAPSPKKAVIRIMGRDYPLTLTTYKRIAIGIRIDQASCCVEIAIADGKFNELCFPMSTWKLLLQQEPKILQRFCNIKTLSSSIIYASTSRESTVNELPKYRIAIPPYTWPKLRYVKCLNPIAASIILSRGCRKF